MINFVSTLNDLMKYCISAKLLLKEDCTGYRVHYETGCAIFLLYCILKDILWESLADNQISATNKMPKHRIFDKILLKESYRRDLRSEKIFRS